MKKILTVSILFLVCCQHPDKTGYVFDPNTQSYISTWGPDSGKRHVMVDTLNGDSGYIYASSGWFHLDSNTDMIRRMFQQKPIDTLDSTFIVIWGETISDTGSCFTSVVDFDDPNNCFGCSDCTYWCYNYDWLSEVFWGVWVARRSGSVELRNE